MKIRTFDFPKFKVWYKNSKEPWKQKIGIYYCSIETHELFKKRYYSIEIVFRGYPGYVDTIFKSSININKSKNKIKKWYKKAVIKANKTWKKELKPYFVE